MTGAERYFAALLRARWLIVAVTLLVGGVATWRTVRTYANIRSDLEELLPADAPSVRALGVMRERLPGLRHLAVVVRTGGPENVPAATRFLDELKERVRAYPSGLVGRVWDDVRAEREFVETYALQMMEPADVERLRDSVEELRDWHATRGMDADLLSDEEDPKPEVPVTELRQKYEQRYGKSRDFPDDRLVSEDGETAVLLAQVGAHSSGQGGDGELLSRVQADVASLGFPDAYAPGLTLGYAGDVAAQVEELEGLKDDLGLSGLLVILLVCGSVAWFFRSLSAIAILAVPLFVGTVCAFAVVALPPLSIHTLNTNTAFLGAIVIGNGINTGIILLARYQEEQARGRGQREALCEALAGTWRPTLGAATAASAAYGSLIFTEFRGFNQFGWIGGFGMLFCWLTAFTLGPLVIWSWGGSLGARAMRRARNHGWSEGAARLVTERPRVVLVATLALFALCLVGVGLRRADWLETDFGNLRRRDSFTSGEQHWSKHLDATLGTYLTPSAVLAPDAESAARIEEEVKALKENGRAGELIASVRSVRDVLRTDRDASREVARELRAVLTPKIRSELQPDERERLERATGERGLGPLALSDVPEPFLTGLREHDGSVDRSVLVFPKLGSGTWDTARTAAYATDLREVAARAGGLDAVVGGSILLTSDILTAMEQDGPRATLVALAVVLIVMLVALRSVKLAGAAMLSLVVGIALMLGAMAWCGLKVNFANFVALPITFGVAADYSLNVLKRGQQGGVQEIGRLVAGTGGAVALCSVTTIIGFGSLLVANNLGLFSFGAFAVAGELGCLYTAVLALPAALVLMNRAAGLRRDPSPAAPPAEPTC